jgi:PDZ domain-containing protein
VTKATTSVSKGQLRLTTVGVQNDVELVWAIRGWVSNEQAVVPRDVIYPPDQSQKEVEEQNQQEFQSSQSTAETAALRELGYPVQTFVAAVTPNGPSAGKLAKDDIITSVDNQPVTTPEKLTELIRAKPAGTDHVIAYTRAGKPGTVVVKSADDKGTPRVGVQIDKKQPHPFDVEIDLGEIGGPSAGLMFTLGIIDKLKPEDLTGGKIIAGTGTIDDEGNVGPIGGIPQKLVGAHDAGAQIFLVPKDNCAEALRNAVPGLPMAEVATVDDALAALSTFTSGGTPKPCSVA